MEESFKARFLRRGGYYFMGVALGLVMLGFFHQARKTEQARLKAQEAQAEAAAREAAQRNPMVPPPQPERPSNDAPETAHTSP